MIATLVDEDQIVYPESDGEPMGENTAHVRWIATILGNLEAMFRTVPDVFVAADLFWYPIRGDVYTRLAPDVLVALGRPKGDRGSYRQWVEGGLAPQVVFEVLSPSNRPGEMAAKFNFYQTHGVLEYYVYDLAGEWEGWERSDATTKWRAIPSMVGWVSPRLKIRFEEGTDLTLYRPDGRPFLSYAELSAEWDRADQLELENERLEIAAEKLQDEKARLAAKLRELGIDPNQL